MIFTLQRKQFHHYLQLKHANHEFITLRNLAKARKRDQILRSSSHGHHMINADKDKNHVPHNTNPICPFKSTQKNLKIPII